MGESMEVSSEPQILETDALATEGFQEFANGMASEAVEGCITQTSDVLTPFDPSLRDELVAKIVGRLAAEENERHVARGLSASRVP